MSSIWEKIASVFTTRVGHSELGQQIAIGAATAAINATTQTIQNATKGASTETLLATLEGVVANVLIGVIQGNTGGLIGAVPLMGSQDKAYMVTTLAERVGQNAAKLAAGALVSEGEIEPVHAPADVVAALGSGGATQA